jgi:hypothetical protein
MYEYKLVVPYIRDFNIVNVNVDLSDAKRHVELHIYHYREDAKGGE